MASFKLSKFKYGFALTSSSGGTLTLTSTSRQAQVITGTLGHTVVLPDATTMSNGLSFSVINTSTGSVVVQNVGLVTLATISAGGTAEFFLSDNSSANGVWRTYSSGVAGANGIATYGPGANKTSDYTVVTGDKSGVINVDTTSGTVKITLPSPASDFNITIKDATGQANVLNYIQVARSSASVKIDGEVNDDIIDQPYGSISYISDGTNWFRISSLSQPATIVVAAAGFNTGGTPFNVIDTFILELKANASDFGDLSVARGAPGSVGSVSSCIFLGGGTTTAGGQINNIDYVNFKSKMNAVDFGDLTIAKDYTTAASNATRGLCFGAYLSAVRSNVIDYITMATAGNAIDFGDLTSAASTNNSGFASSTRALCNKNEPGGTDYVTIATLGNASSFGNLSVSRSNMGACSSQVRGLWAGGNNAGIRDEIDYVTIATTGNAVDFGDLTQARLGLSGASSKVRGSFNGGCDITNTVHYNIIDYVTIAVLGNATDFGDLTQVRRDLTSSSNGHGGI